MTTPASLRTHEILINCTNNHSCLRLTVVQAIAPIMIKSVGFF